MTSKESGYVPAAYLKDIEPKVFKKQVMEKSVVQEKVKVKRKKLKKVLIERKTKEKLVDKRAKRTSSILRKKSESTSYFICGGKYPLHSVIYAELGRNQRQV